jgi:mRNA interferase HigB
MFWSQDNQAEIPLTAWYEIAAKAEWKTPADIKAEFGTKY